MSRAPLVALLLGLLAALPGTAQEQITLEALTTRAEAGEAAAQTALALQYHQGEGVAQNFATAAAWARRAAEAGDPVAQNLLGRYHHAGLGVGKSQDEALRWLSAAAQSGGAQFLQDLGQALEHGADGSSDPARAAEAYAAAAEAGLADAKVSLGLLYQEGSGVAQDYARARTLYEEAAGGGHPRAQNNLGLLYVRGHGVPQDYEKAARLFARAAEAGLPGAIRNLGVMYENGFGVPVNEAYAAELYRLASGQASPATSPETPAPALAYDPRLQPLPPLPEGTLDEQAEALAARIDALRARAGGNDPVAQFQAGWILVTAPGATPPALYEAARHFRAAAEAGYGPAMRNLGLMYFTGQGVPQDYVLGRMWLSLAGAAGQDDAAALIETLGQAMTPDQINEAQSRAEAFAQRKP